MTECFYLRTKDVSGCFDHPNYIYTCALGTKILTPEITCRKCKNNSILSKHNEEANKLFDRKNIVGLFLHGSQNYGLDLPSSDIDTKLLITPTLEDIGMGRQPKSHTHVLDNGEHLDYKDVRFYIDAIKKQNPNFVEILFTDYKILNPYYSDIFYELINEKESIGRYDRYATLQAIRGSLLNKLHVLKNPSTEDKKEIIEKYGYIPKEFCNALRYVYFIKAYIAERPYIECLRPTSSEDYKEIKRGCLSLQEVDKLIETDINPVITLCEEYLENYNGEPNKEIEKLLNDVKIEIVKRSLRNELNVSSC